MFPSRGGDSGMSRKWRVEFEKERARLNEIVLSSEHLGIKRFFALDDQAYHEGALTAKVKELMGLVASLVLRCDDCVSYHILKCVDRGVSREELYEAFNVALVVGGSIVIPHLRRAADKLEAEVGAGD
jgi:AhpD family alkylhydroperoxidase